MPDDAPPARRRRGPRPATRRRIFNQATWYLQRYFAPRAHVRRILMRKQHKAIEVHGGDLEEIEGWVDEVLDSLEKQGVLDDRRYAIDKARGLVRRGTPERGVRTKLGEKGVPHALIEEAIANAREEFGNPDIRAAARYVRRRRLGPYRPTNTRAEHRDRDLAKMARAGFSYGLASRVLSLEDGDAVEVVVENGAFS